MNKELSSLKDINFINGTLVEYYHGKEFDIESSRGKIIFFEVTEKYFSVKTDTEAQYYCVLNMGNLVKGKIIKILNNIYYIYGGYYLNICFALAPPNVYILKPEERFLAFSNN